MSAASPGGNDPVTAIGTVSANTRPPPGRRRARIVAPMSAACSAAIARPRPELPRCGTGRPCRTGRTGGAGRRRGRPARGRRLRSRRRRASRSGRPPRAPPGHGHWALSSRLPRMRSSRRASEIRRHGAAGTDTTASGRRTPRRPPRRVPGPPARRRPARRRRRSARSRAGRPRASASAGRRRPGARRAARIRRQVREAGLDQRRLCDERRQRGPELVRHVGHELAVLPLRRLEPGDRASSEAAMRLTRRQPAELVGPPAGTRAARSPPAIRRAAARLPRPGGGCPAR